MPRSPPQRRPARPKLEIDLYSVESDDGEDDVIIVAEPKSSSKKRKNSANSVTVDVEDDMSESKSLSDNGDDDYEEKICFEENKNEIKASPMKKSRFSEVKESADEISFSPMNMTGRRKGGEIGIGNQNGNGNGNGQGNEGQMGEIIGPSKILNKSPKPLSPLALLQLVLDVFPDASRSHVKSLLARFRVTEDYHVPTVLEYLVDNAYPKETDENVLREANNRQEEEKMRKIAESYGGGERPERRETMRDYESIR